MSSRQRSHSTEPRKSTIGTGVSRNLDYNSRISSTPPLQPIPISQRIRSSSNGVGGVNVIIAPTEATSPRRIYQPPILQSGYKGRDKNAGEYIPFSPSANVGVLPSPMPAVSVNNNIDHKKTMSRTTSKNYHDTSTQSNNHFNFNNNTSSKRSTSVTASPLTPKTPNTGSKWDPYSPNQTGQLSNNKQTSSQYHESMSTLEALVDGASGARRPQQQRRGGDGAVDDEDDRTVSYYRKFDDSSTPVEMNSTTTTSAYNDRQQRNSSAVKSTSNSSSNGPSQPRGRSNIQQQKSSNDKKSNGSNNNSDIRHHNSHNLDQVSPANPPASHPRTRQQPSIGSSFHPHRDSYAIPTEPLSPTRQRKLSQWYQNRFPVLSKSESTMQSAGSGSFLSGTTGGEYPSGSYYEDDDGTATFGTSLRGSAGSGGVVSRNGFAFMYSDGNEDDYMKTRQGVAYMSLILTSVQLLTLMLQLTMCGVAPLDVNPMVGPFPDAFSEWGGKNAYLMVTNNQWWRIFTPALLHVGVLHLLVNAFCQLEAVAMFEREWGTFRWLIIYFASTFGCSVFSNFFDGNTIAVGSSGSLMGMYAAKLAEVATVSCFETIIPTPTATGSDTLMRHNQQHPKRQQNHQHHHADADDVIRLDQLSSVLCGLVLVSLLGSFTFIDWSGNMGGLLSGFLSGLIVFGFSIRGCCSRFLWVATSVSIFIASLGFVSYEFYITYEPDDELGDVCEYYRHLYPENVECGCFN